MSEINIECPECGRKKPQERELCVYCRREKDRCDYFEYKNMRIPVPWCNRKDKRIIVRGGLLCDECERSDNK